MSGVARRISARLPDGERVDLDRSEAEALVAALWAVSAQQGAVTAIGKILHRLGDPAGAHDLELSATEVAAVRMAVDRSGLPAPSSLRALR